ncbi:hypothetical protein IV500_07125 [Paeniglutamicibacter antarcticus]|uniref:Uncharacterized protein n=1 Tax=Arthrobacter terrae TaxID=2935737 RepID=A0A931G552_9MICC|nr:hypothetical protein [Arthrobacter terrae]MBG0739165.1 hypothetical protein [Arthrobacter terrae]
MTSYIAQEQGTVGFSRSVEVLADMELGKTIIAIVGASVSRAELQTLDSDLILVHSAEEFLASGFVAADACLVVPSGLNLARKLVADGLINFNCHLIWAFGLPVIQSLDVLQTVDLPEGSLVCGFGGLREAALLVTARNNHGTEGNQFLDEGYDAESFRAGIRVGVHSAALSAVHEQGAAECPSHGDLSSASRLLNELRLRHLNLLQTLGPTMDAVPHSSELPGPPEAVQLENELILLKRRHDALERKYNSLAGSRLGRLTLKLWDRKRFDAPASNELKEPKS